MKIVSTFLLLFWAFVLPAQTTLTINTSKEYQTISGFGAFGGMKPYWEQGPFHTQKFLDYYLKDLGTTIVRTNIFWDLEPSNENTSANNLELGKFNYKSGSDLSKQLPYYKALKEAGLKKLIATAWTPPVWMKLLDDPKRIPNECYNCNNCAKGDPRRSVCGGRLDPKLYYEFAEYLVAYVKIVKQEAGVDIYALNFQNEPYFANPFEASVMLPEEYADVLRIVGQRFREEGLSTKLYGPEHMAEWSWGVQRDYVTEILGDESVNRFLDIYAVHGYVDGVAPDFGSAEGWTALRNNITIAHKKPLWMTETSGYKPDFNGALDLAKSMYLAFRFGEISAWVYWSISAEPGSSFALMANGEPTVLFYASKQFFRFIRPGAIRIEASANAQELLPLAFKNPFDGSMTIVLINSGNSDLSVLPVFDKKPSSFSITRTSANESASEVGTYQSGDLLVPAKSIVTLYGTGPSAPSFADLPDQYLKIGSDNVLEIPISEIVHNSSGAVSFSIETDNNQIISSSQVQYEHPSATGKIILQVNTTAPGKATVTLRATNGNTSSGNEFEFNSSSKTFVVEVISAVVETAIPLEHEITVSPNPSSGLATVSFPQGKVSFIRITDVKGSTVHEQTVTASAKSINVPTSQWRKGLYLVQVAVGDRYVIKKLIL